MSNTRKGGFGSTSSRAAPLSKKDEEYLPGMRFYRIMPEFVAFPTLCRTIFSHILEIKLRNPFKSLMLFTGPSHYVVKSAPTTVSRKKHAVFESTTDRLRSPTKDVSSVCCIIGILARFDGVLQRQMVCYNASSMDGYCAFNAF